MRSGGSDCGTCECQAFLVNFPGGGKDGVTHGFEVFPHVG